MSRSKPTRRLYCSKCKAKHPWGRSHFNVMVLGRTLRGAAQCRCITCGHEYVTNSEHGRRKASRLWTAKEDRFNR